MLGCCGFSTTFRFRSGVGLFNLLPADTGETEGEEGLVVATAVRESQELQTNVRFDYQH